MSCVWHEMWRPKRKRCEHCCVSLLAVDIDSVWWGVAAGSWCTGGTLPRNLPVPLPFVYFITLSHLPHPPPCPSISATIALWAIWSSMHFTPPPLSLSLCLSFSALPSCLHPQLAAVARHQGQISTPFPASLSSSVFLFLPPLTLHFLCSDAILKFLSLPV